MFSAYTTYCVYTYIFEYNDIHPCPQCLRNTRFIRWLTNQKLMLIDLQGALIAILNMDAGKAEAVGTSAVDESGNPMVHSL